MLIKYSKSTTVKINNNNNYTFYILYQQLSWLSHKSSVNSVSHRRMPIHSSREQVHKCLITLIGLTLGVQNNGGFFCPTCKRKFRVAVYPRFKATHRVTLIYCHKAIRVEDWATVLDLKWVGILLLGARGDEKQHGNSDSPVLFLERGKPPIWFSIIPPMFYTVGRRQ